mgnify:CR=1 FL=1
MRDNIERRILERISKQGRIAVEELFKEKLHSVCTNARGSMFKGEHSVGESAGEFGSKGEQLRKICSGGALKRQRVVFEIVFKSVQTC